MSSREESLQIPKDLRLEVWERDGGACRRCGQTSGLVLHHVHYGGDTQGMGGRRLHRLDNIVTLGGAYSHDCHQVVHSDKGLWVPLLDQVIATPGVTALQLRRWMSDR